MNFSKIEGSFQFYVFFRYLGQFCWRLKEREVLHRKCIFGYFLEHLGLMGIKIKQAVRKRTEKYRKLEKFIEGASLAF